MKPESVWKNQTMIGFPRQYLVFPDVRSLEDFVRIELAWVYCVFF